MENTTILVITSACICFMCLMIILIKYFCSRCKKTDE